MNIKRTWKIGAVALIVAAALVYSFLPKPIPVESAEIGRGVLEVTVQEDGKTRVKDRFEIIAPLAGRLLRVDLRPGYEVEAGKTQLAVIVPADPELMDARSRARAEADVKVAEAALDKAQDELARAERALELAQIELAKSERLFEEQYVTEDQVTRGRYDVKIREAERAAAEKGVRVARFNLEQARAALISAQGGDASVGFSILSPIDGKVFRVFRESEGFITFGEKIMELADPHNLEIAVDLLSKEAVHVKPGDPVRLEHWGGDEPLNGRVRLVEPSGFTKISALGVEEQRVNVIIDLVDPPEIWSRLTAEKLVGLIYLLARSCAPDSQHFEVIRARLGLGDEQLELAEIAEITHLHRDRVRWIQERVLNTIVYQLNMKTRGHARLLEQLARRIIAAREGDPAEVLFAFCASFLEDGVDWMVAALLYIACDFSRSFAEAARKARYHKTRLAEAFLGSYTEQLGRDTLTASLTARLEDAAAVTGSPIHNRLPHLDGQHRASEDDSLCRQGSFLSRKCNAQISYRTLEEHCFFLFLERAGEVVWYGDRAFAIPYEDGGFARRFYPSAALVTDEGKGVVIDIQTPLEMVRRRTLIKALRACDHLARQGLAFMLCTREGHTLTDLAGVAVAHEKRVALTTLIDERGVVSWYEVDRLCRELSLSEPELISLIVNEDLCLQKKPFRLSRLPEGTSFAPMLASGEAACPASA